MRLFKFYIDDLRHALPSELTVEARDERRARELAEHVLNESPHHRGVEVCADGARVFGIGSFASRTWCGLKSKRRADGPRPTLLARVFRLAEPAPLTGA